MFSPIPPVSKREFIHRYGKQLVKSFQKHAFYTPSQVKKIHAKMPKHKLDYLPWAMAVFCTKEDFDYHFKEELFDYETMRKDMFQEFETTDTKGTSVWFILIESGLPVDNDGCIGFFVQGVQFLFGGIWVLLTGGSD